MCESYVTLTYYGKAKRHPPGQFSTGCGARRRLDPAARHRDVPLLSAPWPDGRARLQRRGRKQPALRLLSPEQPLRPCACLVGTSVVGRRCPVSIIKPFVARLERRWAGSRAFFFCYALPYRGVVRREVKLARIGTDDHVLAIGCGALPFTAVLVARMTGARITAVDFDPVAVTDARRVIERLGLGKRITVIEADAARDPLPAAEVALVALQAAPKDSIHHNLLRSLPASRGRALYRLPRRGLEGEYGSFSLDARGCACARHRMPTFDRSVLIEPAPGALTPGVRTVA
ncbi:MAG: methyltransferase domain-containing protein [Spirochaetaceae bacterium]|nr:MAG: methyltransferase domain-containing protein [Spirochaetaceae bacterium]